MEPPAADRSRRPPDIALLKNRRAEFAQRPIFLVRIQRSPPLRLVASACLGAAMRIRKRCGDGNEPPQQHSTRRLPGRVGCLERFRFCIRMVVGRKCNLPNMSRVLVMDRAKADTGCSKKKSLNQPVTKWFWPPMGSKAYGDPVLPRRLIWRWSICSCPEPGGAGNDKALKQQFPDFPIIAMSGNSLGVTLLSVARRLGAAAVLQKPFFPEELLEAIKHLLRPKRRRTAKKQQTSLSEATSDGR